MSGLATNSAKPIIDPTAFHSGAVKPVANEASVDAKDIDRRIQLLARAIVSLQSQSDTVNAALRKPVPFPSDFYLTDPTGRVIASIGFKSVNATQVYGLSVADLGNGFAGFVGVQTELPLAITATSNASPDVITINAHGYMNGDTVFIQGALGDTAINGIRIVENVTTNTFTLTDLNGAAINGNGAYGGSGTATRYFGGGYFQTLAIGGSSVPTAKIRAYADGSVKIIGATFTLDANGVTTTIGNLPAGSAGTAGIDVKNDTAPSQDIQVTDKGFFVRATDQATFVAQMQAAGDAGSLSLRNLGGTFTVSILGSQARITLSNSPSSLIAAPNSLQLTDGTNTSNVSGTEIDINIVNAVTEVRINGTQVISSSRDATFHSVNVSGTRIDASGNVSSANGASGTVTLAKLTGGGSNGSLTFVNGIVTGFSNPT